jgi:hypothetical protein
VKPARERLHRGAPDVRRDAAIQAWPSQANFY